jgi:cardiolipin synthase
MELARRLKQTSPLGAILDPVADKMLIAASITILAANANIRSTTLCPAMIIILRETMIGGLREHLAGRGPRIASSHTAKWKTATQMAAIGLLMASTSGAYYVGIGWLPIERLGRNMLWIAAALSLASAWPYVKAATAQTSQDQRLKAL